MSAAATWRACAEVTGSSVCIWYTVIHRSDAAIGPLGAVYGHLHVFALFDVNRAAGADEEARRLLIACDFGALPFVDTDGAARQRNIGSGCGGGHLLSFR